MSERSEKGGSELSVYDGRTRLGEVFDLGCRAAAQLADGVDLGTFPNIRAATDAVIKAAKARAP